VRPSGKLKERFLILMAFQADGRTFLNSLSFEGKNKFLFPARIDVPATRAMAGFTAFAPGGGLWIRKGFPVGIFILKSVIEFAVTNATSLRYDFLHVTVIRELVLRLSESDKSQDRWYCQRQEQEHAISGPDHRGRLSIPAGRDSVNIA
jgi:hypothetical protein